MPQVAIAVQSDGAQLQVPASVQKAFGVPVQMPHSSVPPHLSSQTPQSTLSFLQVGGLHLGTSSSSREDVTTRALPSGTQLTPPPHVPPNGDPGSTQHVWDPPGSPEQSSLPSQMHWPEPDLQANP